MVAIKFLSTIDQQSGESTAHSFVLLDNTTKMCTLFALKKYQYDINKDKNVH